MPEKQTNDTRFNRRDFLSITGLTLATIFTTQNLSENLNEDEKPYPTDKIPNTQTEHFPLTLAGLFLDKIQEVMTHINSQAEQKLAPHFTPYLQQIHDSYATSLSHIPDIYAKRVKSQPNFQTLIAHQRSYFDRQSQTLKLRLHHRMPLTNLSHAIQILRHRDLETNNPFQVPEHMQQAFLYATAFEFNNLLLNDYLAAIYTNGEYIPNTQKHLNPETFKESLATHLAHHHPKPNTLRKQTHYEKELATEYFQGYLQEQSTLTEIPNTNLHTTEKFIELTSQKPKRITSTEIKPVLFRSY